MKSYTLKKSDRKEKKLMLVDNETNKKIHFGASGYMDYLKYIKRDGLEKANQRKKLYTNRHRKEDKSKINPASLSQFILWNKPNLRDSIKDYENKYKIKIINKV
jgi:hypothetical protein